LPLLTEAEQDQLLVGGNKHQAEYPIDKCIHELFEAQVVRTPDAVAVVFEAAATHLPRTQANQLAPSTGTK